MTIAIRAALTLALLLAGCGTPPKKQFVVAFSQANNAEPYRQHVNDELTTAAKAIPQFTLQIADGAGNVNTQTSQVDNFITQKVDLICVAPADSADRAGRPPPSPARRCASCSSIGPSAWATPAAGRVPSRRRDER